MKEPLISIITISYNSELTIERTIKYVLSQTYEYYEYIIVDGASKDGTVDIIKDYEPLFQGKMRWVSEPDCGIYDAMNKGIRMTKGDIIGIVNSDDWLEPNALQTVYELSKRVEDITNTLFCGSIYFHYTNGEKQFFKSNKQRFYEGIPRHSYNFGAFHPAIFVGKEVYASVGLFDVNFEIEADTDFIFRCYTHKKSFVFTDNVLSNMSDGGTSNVIKLGKYYNEKKYYLKKNGIHGISAVFLLLIFLIKICFKKYLPDNILRMIREKRKEYDFFFWRHKSCRLDI